MDAAYAPLLSRFSQVFLSCGYRVAIVWLSQHLCYRARSYRVPIVWLSCGYCVAVDGRSLPSQYIAWLSCGYRREKFTVTVHRVATVWLSWEEFTVTLKTPLLPCPYLSCADRVPMYATVPLSIVCLLPYPYLSCADRVFKVACGCRAGYCS